jgi:hypothetical protein
MKKQRGYQRNNQVFVPSDKEAKIGLLILLALIIITIIVIAKEIYNYIGG